MGTTNSKPSGPIIMIDQSKILSCRQVQFITFFFGGAQLRLFPATASCTNLVQKTNFLSYTCIFLLSQNKFYCLESHTVQRWRRSKDLNRYSPLRTVAICSQLIDPNETTCKFEKKKTRILLSGRKISGKLLHLR